MAFALNKWNENRRDYQSENKTLMEIRNGLELDLQDLKLNMAGHEQGNEACRYFRRILENEEVSKDSMGIMHFMLFRDFISIQNKSGYESLKSKGLELIRNDSLRLQIISLYDFHYEMIEKLEETYSEMQFNENYAGNFHEKMAEFMVFDTYGRFVDIEQPVVLSRKVKNQLFSDLWRVENNRNYALHFYGVTEKKIRELIDHIDGELNF